MTLKADVAYLGGLDFFGEAVHRLNAADWQRESPCAGWRALDVLGHVGQAVRFGSLLLQDARPAWAPVEPPGALVEGDPGTWWAGLADQARRAVDSVDLDREVDSPAGRRTVGAGLSFPAIDLYIHGWDVARSAGLEVVIPAAAIGFAHAFIDAIPVEQVRNPRVFDVEKPVPADATASAAFLAWTGRDPTWRSTA